MDKKIIHLLRLSIAFTFLYAAISGFLNPHLWLGYIPSFAEVVLPKETLLKTFGIVEILLALGLLLMKNPFYLAILSAFLITGIIAFNTSQFSVLFRDVPIVLMSIALAIYYHKNNRINYYE